MAYEMFLAVFPPKFLVEYIAPGNLLSRMLQ